MTDPAPRSPGLAARKSGTLPTAESAARVRPNAPIKLGAGLDGFSTDWGSCAFPGVNKGAKSLAEAVAKDSYFTFTLAPQGDVKLTIKRLLIRAGADEPMHVALMSSVTGFTAGKELVSCVISDADESHITSFPSAHRTPVYWSTEF